MQSLNNGIDALIDAADKALKTLTSESMAHRPSPAENIASTKLSQKDRFESIRLMRVNHSGEISAQALYRGQSIFARSASTKRHLLLAAEEEQDHLAWCSERLKQLGGRPSVLDPIWYSGSFMIGMMS